MPDDTLDSLSAWIGGLAADAVAVQRLLDKASCQAQREHLALVWGAPEPLWEVLLPMMPPRLSVTSHRMTCSLRTKVSWSGEVSIGVKAINLGYALTYRTSHTTDATITVEVEQIPVPTPRSIS